jgi:large subunit ribosomal protein L30
MDPRQSEARGPEAGAPPGDGKGRKKIRISQYRSGVGFTQKQRRVLQGLGLSRPGRSVVREDTPSIRGMCAKIPHLVRFEEVSE